MLFSSIFCSTPWDVFSLCSLSETVIRVNRVEKPGFLRRRPFSIASMLRRGVLSVRGPSI